MNLKKSLGRGQKLEADDLNITPVMNIFLILVPFLLLTAVFVRISIIEFSLPSSDTTTEANQDKTPPVVTILTIRDSGFELKSKDISNTPITKKNAQFDYQLLVEQLRKVKERYARTQDIIIVPDAQIKYDVIIQVMDRCRENGFPNISISG